MEEMAKELMKGSERADLQMNSRKTKILGTGTKKNIIIKMEEK